MNDTINIQGYLNNVNAPWGKLFYKLVWHNLNFQGKNILDFGSGFGVTANHYAEKNVVTAIEPNKELLKHRICDNEYTQLVGGIELLKKIPDQSYDIIMCHNVLEYMDNRTELLCEFNRILHTDGVLSIVKHNKAGKIMQKAVFDYKINETLELLDNKLIASENFGMIHEFNQSDLIEYTKGSFEIIKTYGVRMFFSLQRNELKENDDWISNMYQLECATEEIPEFRNIAFFHHIILKHTTLNMN